jgi:hypothetical protein
MKRGLAPLLSRHENGMPMTTGRELADGKAVGGNEPEEINVTGGALVMVAVTLDKMAAIPNPPLESKVTVVVVVKTFVVTSSTNRMLFSPMVIC